LTSSNRLQLNANNTEMLRCTSARRQSQLLTADCFIIPSVQRSLNNVYSRSRLTRMSACVPKSHEHKWQLAYVAFAACCSQSLVAALMLTKLWSTIHWPRYPVVPSRSSPGGHECSGSIKDFYLCSIVYHNHADE